MHSDPLVRQILEALVLSVDSAKLRAALGPALAGNRDTTGAAKPAVRDAVLERLVIGDLLDASILGARSGERSFPLRILFGRMGEDLTRESAFALSCGVNFYFRASMDEESRIRVGLEVSRAFYTFARDVGMTRDQTAQVAPLFAELLNGELTRVRLESVDHLMVFDSQVHEREAGADVTRSSIGSPRSFLCRVAKTGLVRTKAMVIT